MLQQILRNMYVDPEILSGLDEQQKQTLFCRMREEQVRRWTVWDNQQQQKTTTNESPKVENSNLRTKKSVSFMVAADGEPWVWVMGEHPNDKSIEQILKEEAMGEARKLAEQEAEELRMQLGAELMTDFIVEMNPKIEDLAEQKMKIQDDIYCSVDELREKINKPMMKGMNNYTLNYYQNKNKFNVIDTRDVLNELNTQQKVAQKVALWEQRLTEQRTCEILQKMQKRQLEAAMEAEEAEIKQELLWKEQERRAKEAEQQIREIARRAREEHRLSSSVRNVDQETPYSSVTTDVPQGKQSVLEWYKNNEISRRAGMVDAGQIEPWFHGLITRSEAEQLLQDQQDGSFLVRLSERLWGYAISYKARDKCKHYLINAGQSYSFLGSNQLEHRSLKDLIEYHKQCPLSGGEKLLKPCPRTHLTAINELFKGN